MIAQIEHRTGDFWQREQTQYWLLAGITVLAALLRFFNLGAWSFWIDEIYTINRAADVIERITTWPIILPPTSVILTHYVIDGLGTTEWTARLVSTLIGILSITILYFPIRRIFSPAIGLITVLLLAISPWHLYWSQNARFYTSMQLLYSLAFFAFFIGYEEGKKRYLVLMIPLLILATGERLSALLMVPVIVVYLLLLQFGVFSNGKKSNLRYLFLLIIPIILLAIYDAYRYFVDDYSLLLSSFETFFGQPIDDPFRLMTFVTFNIGVAVMIMAVFGAVYFLMQKSRAGLYVTLGAFIPIAISLFLSLFVFFKDRYIFTSLVNWLILAAAAVIALWQMLPRQGKFLAIGVLCILVAESLWVDIQYFSINHGHRRDWRGAFEVVEIDFGPSDIVSSSRPALGEYYLETDVVYMGDISPNEVQGGDQIYWFVADSESVWVTGPIWDWVRTNAELVDERMLRIPEDRTLWVYRYDPSKTKSP